MKLADHVEHIRQLIDKSFQNRLGRMGFTSSILQPVDSIPKEYRQERNRIESIREVLIAETGTVANAYEKLVEELTFTLFNRLAALKVMEAHTLNPEIITRQSKYGNRSFAHFLWLEQNPDGRDREMEGLDKFFEDQLYSLSNDIPLFNLQNPYHLLPTAIELNGIMNAFNEIETDPQVETDIWKSDDVLGWLYESYNNYKKIAHKESEAKTEFNKVSIQSQVYTPRWVVKFLVDNSLGKLYLEMYPDSSIKNRYKIANAPKTQTRIPKSLTEIKLIDPATGSGNFLLYGFDLFYDLYTDQIENYGADYDDRKIAELIITNNLHGIDLDDRAIQLAQLGLYIKAKRTRGHVKIDHFNIISSDFFLPAFDKVKHLFEDGKPLSSELEGIVTDLWSDLQQAYKFGSLIRLEEKFIAHLKQLDARKESDKLGLFAEEEQSKYGDFRENFFTNLQKAVTQNTAKQGITFLNTKTQDAITFLQLLTQKYEVAVANPPYTDSGNFGPEIKSFIDANYRQPLKFNSNLYASFFKRCCEIIVEKGKVALVHPPTFMCIKTFEDVRKYMIDKMHISLFVDWGYLGMFNPTARVDSAMYILEKEKKDEQTIFIKLNDLYEGKRYNALFESYEDLLSKRHNERNYTIDQNKLKIIEGWPFIYWFSDSFRNQFTQKPISEYLRIGKGLTTANNEKFLRYHWEVNKNDISKDYVIDNKRWVSFAKGGPFNKWYGNIWLVADWDKNGFSIKNNFDENGKLRSVIRNSEYYFIHGLTSSLSSSKGITFRELPHNHITEGACAGAFLINDKYKLWYFLGLLNSNMVSYIADALNSTVTTEVGDIQRIPFVNPKPMIENSISVLVEQNVKIKKVLNSYSIIENNYDKSLIISFSGATIKDRLLSYLNFENYQITLVLLNEAIINQFIFNVYDLCDEDRQQVEAKMGKLVGDLPILEKARKDYLAETNIENEILRKHIADLAVASFNEQQIQTIKADFDALYQSNKDLGEFCIRHQVNPINVWYWFKESKILPQGRTAEIVLEFLADAFRTILMEDEDGIIPLIGLPGEPKLVDRLEQYCFNQGFTSAQFMQLDGLIGRPINEYIEYYFFKNFSDCLNLFMYLPKTPFIWHLSSGEHQGFEVYIIIYKWNRDSLYKLKSHYITKREDSLRNRLMQIGETNTAQAQLEKETIRMQLQEIIDFTKKIDELIAEGYDPKLDDGVGKNIAPLQKKGLLNYEVLNKKQLEKYLNADW